MHTQGTHYLYLLIVFAPEKWQVQNAKKVTNINLRIISKPYAHLQTMTNTLVKFQKNGLKTVGGVAHTRYLLLEGGTEPHNHGKPNTISPRFSSKRLGTTTGWIWFQYTQLYTVAILPVCIVSTFYAWSSGEKCCEKIKCLNTGEKEK